MRYLLLVAAYLALTAYALTDLSGQRGRIAGMPRWAWALVIILIPILGALLWIVFKYIDGNRAPRRPTTAPDDDPDYLRWLSEQNRFRDKRGQ